MDRVDGVLVDTKALLQYLILDRRLGLEQRRRRLLHARVLAAQRRECHRRVLAHVELEVDEALWEDEHLAGVECGSEQRVSGVHEANV